MDLISRQAAIDALVEQTVYKTRGEIKKIHAEVLSSDNRWIGGIDDAIDAIEQLPSAEQEILSYLTDRPCAVCKCHTDDGCSKWECVFEGIING